MVMRVINLVVVVDFRHVGTQVGQWCVDWCIFRYLAFIILTPKFWTLVVDIGDDYGHLCGDARGRFDFTPEFGGLQICL